MRSTTELKVTTAMSSHHHKRLTETRNGAKVLNFLTNNYMQCQQHTSFRRVGST